MEEQVVSHNKTDLITLYVVVPCYNEEEILADSAGVLFEIVEKMIDSGVLSDKSKIIFVSDGSVDRTWDIIRQLHISSSVFGGIKLSKNMGHQVAIYAGMQIASKEADACITIDADLQQDPYRISDFVDCYRRGYDIVYGVRSDRHSDGLFKKCTATAYYKMLSFLGCNIIEQSADYRLLSRRALEALMEFEESNLFIRGIVPTIGFNSCTLTIDVHERSKGQSKYTLRKMITLALDGITSFSIKPLRLFSLIGGAVSLCALFLIIYYIIAFFRGKTISGWTSLATIILLTGGIELIGIGVLGEYIGRTYIETKKRPRYFIDEALLKRGGYTDDSNQMIDSN